MAELRDGTVPKKKTVVRRSCPHENKKDCAMEGLRKQMVTHVKIRKLKKPETDEYEIPPLTLSQIRTGLGGEDYGQALKIVEALRRIVCRVKEVPVDIIMNDDLFERMAFFLSAEKFSLVYETAWVFTNIAAGTPSQARMVVECGAARWFIRLLSTDSYCLVEQCVWALGNIAGCGPDLRDYLLDIQILGPLLRLVDMTAPPNFLCTVAWTISNLCRNKFPSVRMIAIRACLPALRTLIHHKDEAVVSHACWGLSGVTEGSLNYSDELVRYPDLIEKLVELLDSGKVGVLTPTLQTIGNIISADKSWIQIMLSYGLLEYLPELLHSRRRNIRKDACWVVSIIAMGSFEQIKTLINYDFISMLLSVLKKSDVKGQVEASRAIKNLSEEAWMQEAICLIEQDAIEPLCKLLKTKNKRLLNLLLDAITNIMEISGVLGPKESMFHILEETDAVEKIKQMQSYNNQTIRSKSHMIIEKFFLGNSDEESAPENNNDDNQDQYSTDEY